MAQYVPIMTRYFAKGKGRDMSTKQQVREASIMNQLQLDDVTERMISFVLNIFEWKNLPDTIDPYFFELILLMEGKACVIDDPERGGYLGLPVTEMEGMNIYHQHTVQAAHSLGYYKKYRALTKFTKDFAKEMLIDRSVLPSPVGVMCQDNYTCYPMITTIQIYAEKIADTMRSLDVVQKQLKVPSLIEADEDTKTAIQKAIELIQTNVLAVYAGKGIASKMRETKPIQTMTNPSTLTTLWDNYNNLWSGFYTAFGVDNLNTSDKKERLLGDEIHSNDQAVGMALDYRLQCRKKFCEDFNAVFNTNIDVEVRESMQSKQAEVNKGESTRQSEKEGGDSDGSVHKDSK